jgi:predicted nucleic acid-binding protein
MTIAAKYEDGVFKPLEDLHALDALIAATAIENGFTLVTKNRKHFQMIGALDVKVPNY